MSKPLNPRQRSQEHDWVSGQQAGTDLALAVMDDDGWGCAITSEPPAPAGLTAYLAAKERYERLIGWREPGPHAPVATRAAIRQAEAEIDAMKEAAGTGGPGDPLCCQRYSFLHHPAFSVTGCRWYRP